MIVPRRLEQIRVLSRRRGGAVGFLQVSLQVFDVRQFKETLRTSPMDLFMLPKLRYRWETLGTTEGSGVYRTRGESFDWPRCM